MTSNIGSHYLSRAVVGIIQEIFENLERKDADAVVEKTQREVMELLRKTVRPEFLNRVDELPTWHQHKAILPGVTRPPPPLCAAAPVTAA